ncbi:hypothetical protein B0T21DRAFT_186259 [Apiosordaria backusii]|uniref:Uncharacterized protein n=1 Tax=Apiosordaria backusii TaxID=314023 RepID=A0AA40BJQ6_9PEZI|nr:hypothetical protein B0T21DRAFT_186259 [Apiosordaria backusii]
MTDGVPYLSVCLFLSLWCSVCVCVKVTFCLMVGTHGQVRERSFDIALYLTRTDAPTQRSMRDIPKSRYQNSVPAPSVCHLLHSKPFTYAQDRQTEKGAETKPPDFLSCPTSLYNTVSYTY